MEPFVSYRSEVWQPLVNRTPAGHVSHRKLKIKKPCPTKGCHYHVVRPSMAAHSLSRVCPGQVGEPVIRASARAEEPVRCDDSAARISASGVRLLLGVHSGPASLDRREGIRSTYMKWQRATSTLVCFLLGKSGVEPTLLQRTEVEAARWRDVIWLTFNASEGARPRLTIAKARVHVHGACAWHVHAMCTPCAPLVLRPDACAICRRRHRGGRRPYACWAWAAPPSWGGRTTTLSSCCPGYSRTCSSWAACGTSATGRWPTSDTTLPPMPSAAGAGRATVATTAPTTYNPLQPRAAACSPLEPLVAPCCRSQPLHSPCTGNYYKYLCEASGAQPPFPFPFGTLQARSSSGSSGSGSSSSSSSIVVVAITSSCPLLLPQPSPSNLQVLSAAVVRHLASSRELLRFVAQSEEVTAATLSAAAAQGEAGAETVATKFDQARPHLSRACCTCYNCYTCYTYYYIYIYYIASTRRKTQRSVSGSRVRSCSGHSTSRASTPPATLTVLHPLTVRHTITVLHPLTRYVDVMSRAPNLACYRRRGLYQYPQPEHVALHYIKKAEGMQFAWRVLHGGEKMQPKECHKITATWGVYI